MEELDVTGGKALINGSMLLLSTDGFRTVRCGVVARREAANCAGDGSVYVSLSRQTDAEMRSSKTAAEAAAEVADIAPLIGRRFAVLEAGAYGARTSLF